jgi:hypothetical protein
MASDWEDDDWENMDDLDLQITIKNKERELKLLEERKLVEEADLALTEDLFLSENKPIVKSENIESKDELKKIAKPIYKKEKPNNQKELVEKQKMLSQQNKKKKQDEKRKRDIFGEASPDEYEEKYSYIEDSY